VDRLHRQRSRHERLSSLSRRTHCCKKFALAVTTNGYFVVRVERGPFNFSHAFFTPAFLAPPETVEELVGNSPTTMHDKNAFAADEYIIIIIIIKRQLIRRSNMAITIRAQSL